MSWQNHLEKLIYLIVGLLSFIEANQINEDSDFSVESGQSTRQCECWKWPACISNCTANPILKRLLASEYQKIDKIPTPFIVIFPYQVRRQNHKKIDTSTLNKQGNYRLETNFWVHLLNGEDLQLKLKKSSIFGDESKGPRNFYLKYYHKSREVISNNLQKCFYTGTVVNGYSSSVNTNSYNTVNKQEPVSESYIAADTCNGLRGIIQYKTKIYGIKPMKHPLANRNEPVAHFIYPETTTPIDRKAANLKTFWQLMTMSDSVNSVQNEPDTLIVPVSIIIDNALIQSLIKSNNALDSAAYFALILVNYMTKAFANVKQIRVELINIELWNVNDKIPMSLSIKSTLNQLLTMLLTATTSGSASGGSGGGSTSFTSRRHAPFVLLLSGMRFVEDVEYFAAPGTVCTTRSAAIIQVTSINEVYHVSRLMALAVAEIFGIDSFPCPTIYECSNVAVLSKGDENRLRLAILSQNANCLSINSKLDVVSTCGNGKLDRGEECDVDSTSDASQIKLCCDTKSCLVANYAQCTNGGCCSQNCTFLSRGRYCRPATDQCDVPEFCSGMNGECPANIFLENGQPCEKGTALCYQGRCPTRNNQCQKLWGGSALESNKQCYSSYNLKHDDGCGSKGKCNEENFMCGILHCSGGSDKLSDADTFNKGALFMDIYIRFKQKKLQCKFLNDANNRYVEDGSQCGINKYCFGKECMLGSESIPTKCPRGMSTSDQISNNSRSSICFNKGLCTNLGLCLCYPGWSGINCTVAVNATDLNAVEDANFATGAVILQYSEQVKNYIWAYFKEIGMYNGPLYLSVHNPSNPGRNSPETFYFWKNLKKIHLIVILSAAIGLIFIIAITLMVCYRRKMVYKTKASKTQFQNHHNANKPIKSNHRNPNGGVWGRKNNHSELSSRKEADLRLDGGKRQSSANRNRRRGSNGSSSRRLCRDMGDGNESGGAHSDLGGSYRREGNKRGSSVQAAQSENDVTMDTIAATSGVISTNVLPIAAATAIPLQNNNNNTPSNGSVERIIKFGSMPSYKENKMTPLHHARVNQSDLDSMLMLGRSSDPLLSNISSPCHSDQIIISANPSSSGVSSSLLRNHSMLAQSDSSSNNNSTGNSNTPHNSYQATPTHIIINSPNKLHAPIGLPAPALFPSVPYSNPTMINATNSQDKTTTELMMKQPEKGILKNKGVACEVIENQKKSKSSHKSSKRHKKPKSTDSMTSPSEDDEMTRQKCSTSSSSSSSSSTSSANSSQEEDDDSESNSSSSALSASLITHPANCSNSKQHHHHHKQHNTQSGKTKKSSHHSHQNNQAPTILCNAANQTDDNIIKMTSGNLVSKHPANNHQHHDNVTSSPNQIEDPDDVGDDSVSEYLEECDEKDCEECIRLRQQATPSTTQHKLQTASLPSHSLANQVSGMKSLTDDTLITSNSSAYDIVGSTIDDYHQYNHRHPILGGNGGYPRGTINNDHRPGGGGLAASGSTGQNSETEGDSLMAMLMLQHSASNSNSSPQYVGPNYAFHTGLVMSDLNSLQSPNHGIMLPSNLNTTIISNPLVQPQTISSNYQPHYPYSMSSSSYYYPPITNHGTDLSHLREQRRNNYDEDDLVSEVSISAYCRVPTVSCPNKSDEHQLTTHLEATSNNGTIDEASDTSSLPDTHCDLLHNMSSSSGIGPARPNPMLGQMLRAQNQREAEQNSSMVHDSNSADNWSNNINSSYYLRQDLNKSPNQLPNPDSMQTGMDFAA